METSVSVPFWLIDWPSWLSRLIEWLSECSLQVLLWKRFANVSVEVTGGKGQHLSRSHREILSILYLVTTRRSAARRQLIFQLPPFDMLPWLPKGEGDREEEWGRGEHLRVSMGLDVLLFCCNLCASSFIWHVKSCVVWLMTAVNTYFLIFSQLLYAVDT